MDLFAHITIPLLILLALRINTRKVLLMLPLAVVPELDVFFGYHRLLFHNIFIVFLLPLIWALFIYKYKEEWFGYAWIALFFLSSHLLLDITNGVAIFYPVLSTFYSVQVSIYLQNFIGIIPIPSIEIIINTIEAQQTVAVGGGLSASETSQSYPTMDNVSVSLFFTLVVASLMYFRKSFTFLKEVYILIRDILKWFLDKIRSILKKIKRVLD
ncbi:MAG: hypothetical protein R6W73_07515 [Candidatus Saliniplasma sp.]